MWLRKQRKIEDIKREHEQLLEGGENENKPKSVLDTLLEESLDKSKTQTNQSKRFYEQRYY